MDLKSQFFVIDRSLKFTINQIQTSPFIICIEKKKKNISPLDTGETQITIFNAKVDLIQ